MLVFIEGGKPEEKPSEQRENQQQTQPTQDDEYVNRTRVADMGLGRALIHSANHPPQVKALTRTLLDYRALLKMCEYENIDEMIHDELGHKCPSNSVCRRPRTGGNVADRSID